MKIFPHFSEKPRSVAPLFYSFSAFFISVRVIQYLLCKLNARRTHHRYIVTQWRVFENKDESDVSCRYVIKSWMKRNLQFCLKLFLSLKIRQIWVFCIIILFTFILIFMKTVVSSFSLRKSWNERKKIIFSTSYSLYVYTHVSVVQ